jgi:16S rRNA (adenine1518-N6/adenine1519-N6)-dimethyltransferase
MRVLEIGPGLGILTEALLQAGAQVLAVELDPEMAAGIRERLGEQPGLQLIEADAAEADWEALLPGEGWRVVANLPYNVGTRITTALLRHPGRIHSLAVMLQREVVDRMLAPAGSRERGSLSVYIEARARGRMLLRVPPGSFFPPPRVDSAVLGLELRPAPCPPGLPAEELEALVQAAFASPRKTLRSNLSARWGREAVDMALSRCGLDPQLRPSELTLDQWGRALDALSAQAPRP